MSKRDFARQDMFSRVARFGAAHKAKMPASRLSGQNVAIVAECAVGMDAALQGKVVHVGEEKEATVTGATLADALRLDEGRVMRTARAIALDEPGFEKNFLPAEGRGDDALITTARAFLAKLADPATLKKFTDHDLPEAVLDRLEVNADDLEKANAGQTDAGTGHVTATQSADLLGRRGMKACLRLDAIVANLFEDDPETMTEWTRARHVNRAPARRQLGVKTDTQGGAKAV